MGRPRKLSDEERALYKLVEMKMYNYRRRVNRAIKKNPELENILPDMGTPKSFMHIFSGSREELMEGLAFLDMATNESLTNNIRRNKRGEIISVKWLDNFLTVGRKKAQDVADKMYDEIIKVKGDNIINPTEAAKRRTVAKYDPSRDRTQKEMKIFAQSTLKMAGFGYASDKDDLYLRNYQQSLKELKSAGGLTEDEYTQILSAIDSMGAKRWALESAYDRASPLYLQNNYNPDKRGEGEAILEELVSLGYMTAFEIDPDGNIVNTMKNSSFSIDSIQLSSTKNKIVFKAI